MQCVLHRSSAPLEPHQISSSSSSATTTYLNAASSGGHSSFFTHPHPHPHPHPHSSPRSISRMAIVLLPFLPILLLLLFGGTCIASDLSSAAETVSSRQLGPESPVTYYGPSSVAEGDNLTLSCEMSRFEAPQWTHNDRPLHFASGRMWSEPSSESLQTRRLERLVISSVRLSDGGYYRCNAFSRRAHLLHVIPLASRHRLESSTSGNEAVILYQVLEGEGQRVEIDCALEMSNPKSPVYWSKDGNYIERDERRYPDGSRLVIENATSDRDAGIYLCRTDNMEAEGGARFGQYIHLRAPIRVKPFSSGPVLYKVQNESAQVTCRYSGYPRGHITWIVGNQKLNENELRYELGIELQASEEANDTLAIEHLQMDLHNTALTCRVDNTLTADEETLLLNVRENEVYINGPHVLAEKRELRIQCNISEHTNSDRSQVRWYKDNRNIDEIDELRDRLEVEHIQSSRQWTLVIKDAEIGDVGNYTCAHNVNNLNATTRVRSRPLLYPFEEFQATNYKSANVVEGERFSLRCAVAPGYERDARLQWFTYSEEEATGDSGTEPPPAHLLTPINDTHAHIRIEANYSSDSSGSSTGSSSGPSTSASTSGNNGGSDGRSGSSASVLVSVLTIAAVRREDRAYYVCKAHNEVVSFNNTILLRVKDRLAALWPFIGIVCEVLILVLVIFVYEKRRIKPDFDEPDSHNRNQNDEGNWSPPDRASRSQTEVRQRK